MSTHDVLFFSRGWRGDVLHSLLVLPAHVPVVDEAQTLDGLRRRIRRVTCEEQVVSGLNAPCWGDRRQYSGSYMDRLKISPKRMKTRLV